ncbi:LOW QUALITY PROTEIN: biogenesis of lysosome-related organelles complex 1 subunit 3 [Aegotheles albertisi]
MAAPPRVVPGEASESDSEPGGSWGGTPGVGLKVPGEASETDEEEEEEEGGGGGARAEPPPGAGGPHGGPGGGGGVPSLLQQRLGRGGGRLRGGVGRALAMGYGAARRLGGLGGALGRAQATAATAGHCLRVARGDLRGVAATIDIVTACRLLPDIGGGTAGGQGWGQ